MPVRVASALSAPPGRSGCNEIHNHTKARDAQQT